MIPEVIPSPLRFAAIHAASFGPNPPFRGSPFWSGIELLKNAGIPDAVVMAIVGHSSSAMSHRYTHVGKESLARAAATLPEL